MAGLVERSRTLCCGRRNPGSNPEVSPLQFFFLFFNSTLYFYSWTRFWKDKEIFTTQYFIAKHFIHLKESIIVHTRINNSKGMAFGYVITNIYSHLFYQIVFVAWVLVRR